MRKPIGTAVPVKRVRTVAIAGSALASPERPDALLKLRFHIEANARWSRPQSASSFDEMCVDTPVLAGIVITKNNATTVKEPLPVKLDCTRV
jgi:hypothetical protein